MLPKWHYFILFYGWVIFHCIYVPHLLYPFICWWTLRSLPFLIVNSAAVNTGKCISFQIVVFKEGVFFTLFETCVLKSEPEESQGVPPEAWTWPTFTGNLSYSLKKTFILKQFQIYQKVAIIVHSTSYTFTQIPQLLWHVCFIVFTYALSLPLSLSLFLSVLSFLPPHIYIYKVFSCIVWW